MVFSMRLVAEINNGTISRYKELLEDVKVFLLLILRKEGWIS